MNSFLHPFIRFLLSGLKQVFFWSILLIISGLILEHFLGVILGIVLKAVFVQGTDCYVSFDKPTVSLLNMQGAIHNVVIRHKSEPDDAGFRSEKLTVEIAIDALLRKRVLLKTLTLRDTSVSSIGEDTGFIKTLDFLFGSSNQQESDNKKSFLASLFKSWKVWVPRVDIITKPSARSGLKLGVNGFYIEMDEVSFTSLDLEDNPLKPVNMIGSGTNLSVHIGNDIMFPLGNVQVITNALGGRFNFEKLEISEVGYSVNSVPAGEAFGAGLIDVKGEGIYDLKFSANYANEALHRLLYGTYPQETNTSSLEAHLNVQGNVKGQLLHPQLSGDLNLGFEKGLDSYIRDACMFKSLSASYELDADKLDLFNLRADKEISQSSFHLSFDDQLSFNSEVSLNLISTSEFFKRCFSGDNSSYIQAIEKEAFQFDSNIKMSGSLINNLLNFNANAEIRNKDDKQAASLQLSGKSERENFTIELNEKSESTSQKLSVALNYNLARQEIQVNDFNVSSYPLGRVLLFSSPFLSETAYQGLLNIVGAESKLDGKAQASLSSASYAGTANISLRASELNFFSLPSNSLSLQAVMNQSGTTMLDFSAHTQAGDVFANVEVSKQYELLGKAWYKDLALSQWVEIAKYFAEDRLISSGEFNVKGELFKPQYDGKAEFRLASSKKPKSDVINVKGDLDLLQIKSQLADDALSVDIQLPLVSDDKKAFILAKANKLPVDSLIKGAMLDSVSFASEELGGIEDKQIIMSSDVPKSFVTGELEYSANIDSLETGSGFISLSALEISQAEWKLTNKSKFYADISNGRLNFKEFKLALLDKEFEVLGWIDYFNGWNVRLSGELALGSYLSQLTYLEQLNGVLKLDASIIGKFSNPQITGYAKLRDATVSMPIERTIIGVDDLALDAVFKEDSLVFENISGRIGEGQLRAHGEISKLLSFTNRAVDFNAKLERSSVELFDNLSTELSLDVNIKKPAQQRLRLSGDIKVHEMLYENTISLAEVVKQLTQIILGSSKEEFKKSQQKTAKTTEDVMDLDLRIYAPNGLIIDTNVAQAELGGDLRLLGTNLKPYLDGYVKTINGTFGLKSNEFNIINGEFNFQKDKNSLDPSLNIVGETFVQTVRGEEEQVQIAVGGSITKPKVSFSSNGGLSQNEIVSLFGLSAGLGKFRLLRSGSDEELSVKELVNPLSDTSIKDRIVGLTEFSDVEIRSERSSKTGESVPVVSAKRKLTQDVDLNLKSELGEQQQSEIGAEYPLSPTLSLLGGWTTNSVTNSSKQESGNYGLKLRYRQTFPCFIWLSPKTIKQEEK